MCSRWKNKLTMPDHILIIHPSEIIRNGLMKACGDFQDMDIYLLEEGDVVLNTMIQKKNIRILMIDATSPLAGEIINQTSKTRSFKTIGIYYPDDWPPKVAVFDREIYTNMAIDKIQECIRDLLDKHTGIGATGPEGHQLTEREQEVLKLLAMGHSHKEIGRILYISVHTVISHRKNITMKLGIKSISGLTVYAIISGFINTDKIDPESLI